MSFLRRIRIDVDKLPGKAEQSANFKIDQGMLHWKYGIQDLLDASHPYKTRAPLSTDYSGKNQLIQGWDDSLANGWYTYVGGDSGVLKVGKRGLTKKNGGVGGLTSIQIRARFDARQDDGTGSISSLSGDDIRNKINCIGDVFYNNDGAGGATVAQAYADLAYKVGACETAQSVAAGQGRIVVTDRWPGNGGSGATPADTDNNTLAALYPNYFCNVRLGLWALGAPTSPYPDADAYARFVPPAALRAGDNIHLNATGYAEGAKIINAFIMAKGWITAPAGA